MTNKNYFMRLAFVFSIACSLLLLGTNVAFAATDNASTNESFVQGLQKNGAAVDPLRSNPAEALGATDGEFVSLGYGGELIVGFSQNMSGNLLLAVQEVTGGPYPLETADVYVSTESDGPWTLVGEATNEEGTEDGITSLAVASCYQYVRIIDTTDSALHNDTSDGFDVDSLTAEYDENCPIEEDPDEEPVKKAGKLNILLHSSAFVLNDTQTVANTGNNLAEGSYGGNGGNGGDIENEDGEQDVEGSTTGNGGVGGNGDLGGAVQTGEAQAVSSISNTANSNVVRINSCDCNGIGKMSIRTRESAFIGNRALTGSNTGDNGALGSFGGEGGNGGDIENGNDEEEGAEEADQEVDDSNTGSGGAGGLGSAGGSVLTGAATTRASIVNLVNSNRIRIQ
jgi:hypothetical protein